MFSVVNERPLYSNDIITYTPLLVKRKNIQRDLVLTRNQTKSFTLECTMLTLIKLHSFTITRVTLNKIIEYIIELLACVQPAHLRHAYACIVGNLVLCRHLKGPLLSAILMYHNHMSIFLFNSPKPIFVPSSCNKKWTRVFFFFLISVMAY